MEFVFDIVFGMALLLTLICLFIALVSAIQDDRLFRGSIPMIATAISLAWIIFGLARHFVLAWNYPSIHYLIVGLNLTCMLLSIVGAFAIKSQRSWPTGVAASIVAFMWFYIGAISLLISHRLNSPSK